MRKTKIVCTIGPASESEEMLTALCKAGMNVARLNFSHGSHEEHLKRINRIKKVRAELGLPIAIMLDTKGPEFRIGKFKEGKVFLNAGEHFSFTTEDVVGDDSVVSVSYKQLAKELSAGDTILVNNALLEFKVLSSDGDPWYSLDGWSYFPSMYPNLEKRTFQQKCEYINFSFIEPEEK